MTIYIAICDNNIADRKQLERLLEREKDRRLREDNDVLYIDSFGSEEAIMSTPVKYDIFLIDVTEGASNGMEIAKKLRHRGITAPIVLCSSTIDYTSYVNSPDNLIFIEKPLNAGQITHLTTVALEWAAAKTPLIEVRCRKETLFIRYDELVRAFPLEKYSSRLCLSDGSSIDMDDSVKNLARQCEIYDCFIMCKKDLVNIYHIMSSEGDGFRLSNGDIVCYRIGQKKKIIRTMAENLRYLSVH